MKQEILDLLTNAGLLSEETEDLGYVPTGSFAFNRVLSGKYGGGFSVGGLPEIMGESSTGKTVFLTHAFAEAQKLGYYTVMIDNEFSYNAKFAELMGVNAEELIYATPETLEECFAQIEAIVDAIRLADQDTPIVVGFDSIGTATTQREMDEEYEDENNMGGAIRAKAAGKCLRKINGMLRKKKVCLLMVNQIRAKVGVMYGDPTTRAGGGRALLFYCTTSFKVNSNNTSDVLKDDKKNPLGIEGTLRNLKNKTATPFLKSKFKLLWDKGLDPYYGLTDLLEYDGIIERNGAWYTHVESGEKFQSKNIEKFVNNNEDIKSLLRLSEKSND